MQIRVNMRMKNKHKTYVKKNMKGDDNQKE